MGSDVPSDHERSDHEARGNATSAGPAASSGALTSRFHQMFPVLCETEIDRVRRFGEVRRFPAGKLLFQAGEAVPGMYVILSGRIAIEPRDALGQDLPVAAFAKLIEAPVEEMMEAVPGEVLAESALRTAGLERVRCPSGR
jgi:CRP-like cAMP-binding protein